MYAVRPGAHDDQNNKHDVTTTTAASEAAAATIEPAADLAQLKQSIFPVGFQQHRQHRVEADISATIWGSKPASNLQYSANCD